MTTSDTERDLDDQLATALAMAIVEAATPSGRALVIDRVVERLVAVVAAEPNASDRECDSLLFLLDAADEHCWRLDAFPRR